MNSSRDAIKRVVEAFEQSDWSEIDVRAGDVRVHLAATAPDAPSAPVATGGPAPSATPGVDSPEPSPPPPPPAEPPAAAHVVVSPSPGIFWRSPEPGLPPFAEVGQIIDSSATVCIVEVMKLMNHIKAAVGGEVLAVYAENGAAVRKGQMLFAIAPSGSAS